MRRVAVTAAMIAIMAGCNALWGVDDLAIDTSDDDSAASSSSSGAGGGSSSSSSGGGGETGCPPGLTDCSGACIDLLTDPDHCGDCDDPCAPGEQCFEGSCGCPGGLVNCPGGCVDPNTSQQYCGASGSCMGNDAGTTCSPSASCSNGACADSCVNCGFEGGMSGWLFVDLADPYYSLEITTSGASSSSSFFSSAPTEGSMALVHGFDGDEGTIEVGQDVTLAGVSQATLRFDYRAAWNMSSNALPRRFEVWIEPAGGGQPMDMQTILVADGSNDTNDTGPLTGQLDLSPFVSQTVFIRFVWDIPEYYTGPAFFQLDNVRVEE